MTTQYFTRTARQRLAFRKVEGSAGQPVLVWMSGFRSDMDGTKALAVENWARQTGHGAVLFDYSGHGQSDGQFGECTVSDWREDALAVIDTLAQGQLVLVGSSMGGWIALLTAIARPERIKGLVLVAPAADFTEKLMWKDFTPHQQSEIMENGFTLRPSGYGEPYQITRNLIEDGRRWQILDNPIEFNGPVRILQGMCDEDVPWQHSVRTAGMITGRDLVVTLIKDGDHRLSRDQDIARLLDNCREISGLISP